MSKTKKPTMTREEAKALYADLRKSMSAKNAAGLAAAKKAGAAGKGDADRSKVAAEIAKSIKAALASTPESTDIPAMQLPAAPAARALNRGHYGAVALVAVCVAFKVILALLEGAGIMSVENANASYSGQGAPAVQTIQESVQPGPAFDREQVKVLTQLDSRRVELEERSRRLDARESDLEKRDLESTTRLAQLREMTDRLKSDRERSEKKQNAQIEQLANVYGSMNPEEASRLIEQLDITIALALLQKMPEKRMGQILALMTPNKALAITKLLSGSAAL